MVLRVRSQFSPSRLSAASRLLASSLSSVEIDADGAAAAPKLSEPFWARGTVLVNRFFSDADGAGRRVT
jgi:hypothetical protein